MRLIDELGTSFPELDLASVRILLQVYETPGFCIADLAEVLRIDHRFAQPPQRRLRPDRRRPEPGRPAQALAVCDAARGRTGRKTDDTNPRMIPHNKKEQSNDEVRKIAGD